MLAALAAFPAFIRLHPPRDMLRKRASGPRSATSGHLRVFYGSATSSLLMLVHPSVYAWWHLGPCGLRHSATPALIARCNISLLDCDRIFDE